MDVHQIIASGDLDLYILGLLPEPEGRRIEQLARLYPEIRAELDRITESLKDLAAATAGAPSPDVKDRLMKRIGSTGAERPALKPLLPPQAAQQAGPDLPESKGAPVQPVPVRKVRTARWVAALLGATGLFLVVYLLAANRQLERKLAGLQQQVSGLQQQLSERQQESVAFQQTVLMLQSADYRKINLTPVPGKPPAAAQVMWHTTTREVYVGGLSLPAPPANKQYQLWAIVNGQPVDAGVLGHLGLPAQKMKTIQKAEAFAITLENKGGSTAPTMEAMYVMARLG